MNGATDTLERPPPSAGGRPLVSSIRPDTQLMVFDEGARRGRIITARDLYIALSNGLAAWRIALENWRDSAIDAFANHNTRINNNAAAIDARAPIRVDKDIPIAGAQVAGKKTITGPVAGVRVGEVLVVNLRAPLPAQMSLGDVFAPADGQVTVNFVVFAAVNNPAGTVAAVTLTALR